MPRRGAAPGRRAGAPRGSRTPVTTFGQPHPTTVVSGSTGGDAVALTQTEQCGVHYTAYFARFLCIIVQMVVDFYAL